MSLFPRRHRSLIYKLLIFIPALWLTISFLLYTDHVGSGRGNSAENVAHDVNSGLRRRDEGQLLVDSNVIADSGNPARHEDDSAAVAGRGKPVIEELQQRPR